jgi:hypothetical protein
MLTRTTRNNVLLYLTFWAVYGPLVIVTWHSGGGTLFQLSIVLLIGLGIVLAGLFVKERFLDREEDDYDFLEEEPDEERREGLAATECFDNVFKPDFGRVEYDLD